MVANERQHRRGFLGARVEINFMRIENDKIIFEGSDVRQFSSVMQAALLFRVQNLEATLPEDYLNERVNAILDPIRIAFIRARHQEVEDVAAAVSVATPEKATEILAILNQARVALGIPIKTESVVIPEVEQPRFVD